MSPEELDEATVEEAKRRWLSTPAFRIHGTLHEDLPFIAARLARENWTPPEPVVDPDVLAFREWSAAQGLDPGPDVLLRDTYLAGARMAREQERERAKVPIGMAGVLVDRCQRMMHSLPPGVRAQWDVEWGLVALCREVAAEIAKYMGEA